MIGAVLDTIARAREIIPLELWAVLLGLLASWGAAQIAKAFVLKARHRVAWTRVVAVLGALPTVLLIWPGRIGAGVALGVGLASPILWPVAMRLLGRWLPGARDALSGDPGPPAVLSYDEIRKRCETCLYSPTCPVHPPTCRQWTPRRPGDPE